jgi:hypothetical protein
MIPLDKRAEAYKQFMRLGQYKRCPGGSEAAAADGSNVWSADQQQAMDCKEADRSVGNF